MSKTVQRLLTFFIGIPLVLLIVFADYMNNLPLHITIGFFSVLFQFSVENTYKVKYFIPRSDASFTIRFTVCNP